MLFFKFFAFLLNSEKPQSKIQKRSFNWTLNESKFLSLEKVKKLRAVSQKTKSLGIRQNKPVQVKDWFIVELGLFSGLRVEEMANLQVGDLHLQDKASSLTVRRGKGNKSRTIYLKKTFKKECLFYLNWKRKLGQNTGPQTYVLAGPKGKLLTTRALQIAFKRCLTRAEIDNHYSIHSLRHTYGSHLYKASGHNLRLVQEQLGHSSIRTTQVYANLMDNDVKEAAENLYE